MKSILRYIGFFAAQATLGYSWRPAHRRGNRSREHLGTNRGKDPLYISEVKKLRLRVSPIIRRTKIPCHRIPFSGWLMTRDLSMLCKVLIGCRNWPLNCRCTTNSSRRGRKEQRTTKTGRHATMIADHDSMTYIPDSG